MKRPISLHLSILFYRFIGHFQAAFMTFKLKRQYFLALLIGAILSAIPWGLSVLSHIPQAKWTGVIVSAVYILAHILKTIYSYNEYQKIYYAIPLPQNYKQNVLSQLSLPGAMIEAGYTLRYFTNGTRREYYVASDLVNTFLLNTPPIHLEFLKYPYCVAQECSFLIPSILYKLLRRNKVVFNDALIRLAQEIYPDTTQLLMQKSHYFDAQTTNEIVYKQFRSANHLDIVFDGQSLLVNDKHVLFDLGRSPCANIIGVSTLAFTKDKKILIGQQGAHSMANAGRLAPSGSGSLSYSDFSIYKKRKTGCPTLTDLLIIGMERELQEETNCPDKCSFFQTAVTGYARLLERGGKPDFFGITYIDLNSTEIIGQTRFRELGIQDSYMYLDISDENDIPSEFQAFCSKYAAEGRLSIQLHILSEILCQIDLVTCLKKLGAPYWNM